MSGRELSTRDFKKLAVEGAPVLADLIPVFDGTDVKSVTLTLIAGIMNTALGDAISATGLPAMTFTTTGQTSGVIAAVVSTAASWGTATKGQLEFLITTIEENKAAIAEIRAL